MGYECPVCGIPQSDGGHLANHMAFTALVHEDDHEAWLDKTVPEWSEMGEAELAEVLIEQAATADFPQVFEDTTTEGGHHEHDHERSGALFDDEVEPTQGQHRQRIDSPALDGDAQAVLEEARRLTEARLNDEEE
ncbi:DUF5810 domain-containing protein [Halocatena salina]|uniref:DUF5810 domain-containing protein n=1 Tax=Halocatena salina TaxID=2934340 RepID=A0A8U0A346_9EURY|nr:DUF5810 domain-containing protein [Halocatena salina]UPM43600.1 DUF5810 domain-containing protein [Halocatena salina]